MAIKASGTTIIDDNKNISNIGIATFSSSMNVGLGTTAALNVDTNITNDNILSVVDYALNPTLDVTYTGNVGIGTTIPSKKLHVSGDLLVSTGSTTLMTVEALSTTDNILEIQDSNGNAIFGVNSTSIGIGKTSNPVKITPRTNDVAVAVGSSEIILLSNNTGTDNIFSVLNSGQSLYYLTVANSGNVGIGTSTPSSNLHVNGSFLVADGASEVLSAVRNTTNSNILSVKTAANTPAFDVTGIGSVGIGSTQPANTFEVYSANSRLFTVSQASGNTFEVLNPTGNQIFYVTTSTIGVGTTSQLVITPRTNDCLVSYAGTDVLTFSNRGSDPSVFYALDSSQKQSFTISSSGNVGVGTSLPSQRFQVDGGSMLVSAGSTEIFFVGPSTTTNTLSVVNASSSPAFDVTRSGFVGIGTSAPTANFQIVSGSGNQLFSVSDTSGDVFQVLNLNNLPTISIGSSNISMVGYGGSVGIGSTLPRATLNVVGSTILSGITTIGLANTSTPPDNSSLSFELISDTQLRIKVRGTDGVLRSSDITLA